jgi:hypothetical protein
MNEFRSSFDRLAFFARVLGVVAATTYGLVVEVHRHDRGGAIVVGAVGYLVLPYLAYLYTRHRSRRAPPRYPSLIAKYLAKRSGRTP